MRREGLGDRAVEAKGRFDDIVVIFIIMVCITFCHAINNSDYIVSNYKMID